MYNKPDMSKAYVWDEDSEYFIDGNESIGTVYLTGSGYINEPFRGIAVDSQFGWQDMSWKKNPSRTLNYASFSDQMDKIDVYLTARCEINVSYLDYEQFKKLRLILRERHFLCKFFDIDSGKWITREMYATEQTRNKLHILNKALLGTLNISLKFVGTNNDIAKANKDKVRTIRYFNGSTLIKAENVEKLGQQVTLYNPDETVDNIYWTTNSDGTGFKYKAGQSTTWWYTEDNINLYKQIIN